MVAHGDAVEIRRIAGGRIPDGGAVLVSYPAAAQAATAFSTWEDNFTFRLELWQGRLSLYGRYYVVENQGGQGLVLQDVRDTTVGLDSLNTEH